MFLSLEGGQAAWSCGGSRPLDAQGRGSGSEDAGVAGGCVSVASASVTLQGNVTLMPRVRQNQELCSSVLLISKIIGVRGPGISLQNP